MLIAQNFVTALRGLMANKLRSALTILGIVIGVAAVVALMAIGNGATSSITNSISSNGSNLLNVQAGRNQRPTAGQPYTPSYLYYSDYLALSRTLTDVVGIAPAFQSNATVTAGSNSTSTSIIGITEDYLKVHSYTVESGRGLSAADRTSQKQVAVLGNTTASDLFGSSANVVGQTIKISNNTFTVIGVLTSKGSSGFENQDDLVLIPLETGYAVVFGSRAVQNSQPVLSNLAISASSADTVATVSSTITFVLRRTHHLKFNEADDFRIMNQAQLLSTLTTVTTTLTTFLGAIAALSLLVGGIGIMNITLVSVSERTREIGLRKAVGARKDHILFQFLVETMTLSVTGGVVGILFGMLIAWVVTLLGLITAKISISSILLAFFFSMAIGLFFGIYPAFRAANLEPMEALRSE